MEVKQIYELVNSVTKEVLGKEDLVKEDLSGIVDVGTEVFNANAMDNYVKSLVNHIGKVIFVARTYKGGAPKVLMDSWEFGSIVEKIQADIPEATENESWKLENGTSYDPNIFYQPKVSAKFFNSRTTYEIPMSFTEKQVRESFDNPQQLNSFISMLYNAVEKSMTIKIDSLIMRTLNNMIGETLHAEYSDGKYSESSGVRAINLLKLYNDETGLSLTKDSALINEDFLRFASYNIALYVDRLKVMSTLFNVGGKERFTDKEQLHIVLLSDFAKASDVYLSSSTYHKELVSLPNYETIPYWQGSGKKYGFDDISKISLTTSSGNDVLATGIIGVMFDHDALGVTNEDRRVTTNYNPKAEFFSNWYKFDCGYFNDMNENMIVFFIA